MPSLDRSSHAAAILSAADDPRLVEALEAYMEACRNGHAPDREEFLARDPEIASELADCLDALELVEQGNLDLALDTPTAAPDRLGDYRLGRELGRGGMGVVYEAVQLSLGRRVALKVLPRAAALDPRHRQRFQIEAQAAAHLHHPHIVPVFAVGCDQGVHYYAMQYIEGASLATIVRDLRREATTRDGPRSAEDALAYRVRSPEPAPGLSSPATTVDHATANASPTSPSGSSTPGASTPSHRDRAFAQTVARWGVQAAEALAHAHGLGVLHRDIKPANLLVDPHGDVWVTDFGLARFLDPDSSGLTRTGDLLGTLRYMSPEQAAGRWVVVDQRADVYSLGATLYEVLTLRPAFPGKDRQELLNQVALAEPVPPRKIQPTIPRDLETIVLKAMAKEPGARYPSAQALADDLNRFLHDEPIQARRPGPLEQSAKWVRRHRVVLSSMAAVAVAALAVGSILLWIEQERTQKALNSLTQVQKERANDNARTIQMVDEVFYPVMGLAATNPMMKGNQSKLVYGRAIALYERIADDFRDDPDQQHTVAVANRRSGFFRMIILDESGGRASYGKAIAIYEELAGREDPPSAEALTELSNVHREFGYWLTRKEYNQIDDGLAQYRQSIDVMEDAAASRPTDVTIQIAMATSLVDNASAMKRLDRAGEAETQINRLVDHVVEVVNGPLSGSEHRPSRVKLVTSVASLLSQRGLYEPSQKLLRLAIADRPDDPASQNELAWALAFPENAPPEDAAEAVTLARKAVAAKPREHAYLNTLGAALYRAGKWDEAIKVLNQSAEIAKGGDHADCYLLAMVHWKKGNPDEARSWYEKGRAWVKKYLPYEEGTDVRPLRFEAERLLGITNSPPEAKTE